MGFEYLSKLEPQDSTSTIEWLNSLGYEDWELVTVITTNQGLRYFFKRRLES